LRSAIDFAEAAYPRKAWPALHLCLTFSRLLVHQPRVAHRNPPRSFFYKCILQAAIDFAEAAYPRKAWPALHLSLIFSKLLGPTPRGISQPTMQLLRRLQFAIVQLILRSCGCGVGGVERNAARSSAWQALHLSLSFSSGRIATHHAAFSASAN
jgi:hypothetical protein